MPGMRFELIPSFEEGILSLAGTEGKPSRQKSRPVDMHNDASMCRVAATNLATSKPRPAGGAPVVSAGGTQ